MEVTFEQREPTHGLVSGAGAEEDRFKDLSRAVASTDDGGELRQQTGMGYRSELRRDQIREVWRRGRSQARLPVSDSSKVVSRESCQTPE